MNARELLEHATPRPWGTDPAFEGFIGGDPIGSENEWQEVVAAKDSLSPEDAALTVTAVNEYEAHEDCVTALRRLSPAVLHACGGEDALARLRAVRSGT